jgi:hypothetical protein
MCIQRLFFGDFSSGATEESYSPAGARPGAVSRERKTKAKANATQYKPVFIYTYV